MTDQTKPSPDPSRPAVSETEESITTLLGQGAEFSGKLSFDGTVRVDGRFTGEIQSAGTLVVGQAAEIEADIAVNAVLVQGRIKGTIRAVESIELHAPARVKGALITPALHIARGVRFDGECQMTDVDVDADGSKPGDESPAADASPDAVARDAETADDTPEPETSPERSGKKRRRSK